MSQPSQLVIGQGYLTPNKIVSVLNKSSSAAFTQLGSSWAGIARDLDIPDAEIARIQGELNSGSIQFSDALVTILTRYVALFKNQASLRELLVSLRKHQLKECADSLESEFIVTYNQSDDES